MPGMDDLAGQHAVVMGLGGFGGGVGVTRFLVDQGADVLVTDLRSADQLREPITELDGLPVQYRLGEHNVADFTTADLIVVNPAVDRRENRFLRSAEAAGVPLTSEIRLLVERLPDRQHTIGVTGTAGKSTVTAMIGHLIQKARKSDDADVWVGGNIGGSLLPRVGQIAAADWVVLELSSFMLEDLDSIDWSPGIAAVTNISENHLDRHSTMAAYIAAKQTILRHQARGDQAVLGPDAADWPTVDGVARTVLSSQEYQDVIPLPGRHNQFNAMLAISVGEAIALGGGQLHAALADFTGLPHRMQSIAEHDGVRFFNDSKSTTPEAARLAIECFDNRTVHLILGGYDKQSDMSELVMFAAEHCAGVYTIGATGPAIADAASAVSECCPVRPCGDLATAVQEATTAAQPGHVVLLSPACASWDQFDHFEQRGERFIELVRQIISQGRG